MTRMEELRIQQMLRLGCVVCAYLDLPNPDAEVHHLLQGNRRMGDWFTLGICPGHHRGAWTPEQIAVLKPDLMKSISDGRKAFTKIYPTEQELWNRVQERLGLTWPTPKLVARATCSSSSGSLQPID